MRGGRTLKGHEPHADPHHEKSRGEIEALLESPELRRIFNGDPKAPAARFAPSAARRRREPDRHADPVERPLAGLRPRRRRRTRVLIGLVPLYLAGLIAIFEVAREPGSLLRVFDDGAAQAAASESTAVHMMAAGKDVDAPTPSPASALAQASAAPAIGDAGGASREADSGAVAGGANGSAGTAVRTAEGHGERDADLAWSDATVPPADEASAFETAAGSPDTDPRALEKTATDLAKHSARPDWQIVDATTAGQAAPPAEAFMSDFAAVAWNGPYPDPQAPPAPEALDPEAAAAAEEALDLSAQERREIQLRLRLAEFDPRGVDGKFGPDTRTAITGWQRSMNLPATGFLDGSSLALLDGQTDEEFRAWQVTERARVQRQEVEDAIAASSVPQLRQQPKKLRLDGCPRTARGEIAFGHSMSCDARGVRENFERDLRQLREFLR
jgi:peptidoglycan hydrolase-like protein with peptidoglycan-binding domain